VATGDPVADAQSEETEGSSADADGHGRLAFWIGAIPAVAGLLMAASGLSLGQLLVFGLLVLAVLPWAVVLVRPGWRGLTYTLAGALTVVLCACALAVLYHQGHPERARHASGRTPELTFLPVPGPVPHCVSLAGAGHIPHGYELALFDRATDSAGHYTPTSTFSFDGAAMAASPGPGWTAPELYLGSGNSSDEGDHIAITAVLMPEHTVDFLSALTSSSDSGMLPPGVIALGTKTDELVVVRNAQNGRCPT
jgi:hypothetical protein